MYKVARVVQHHDDHHDAAQEVDRANSFARRIDRIRKLIRRDERKVVLSDGWGLVAMRRYAKKSTESTNERCLKFQNFSLRSLRLSASFCVNYDVVAVLMQRAQR